ncbi:hypothetical protein T10_7703 [Trichinella papuae]|uniref:Uncharacterized protein n=1 Tax=Trichinella papuae TaxID=268474 RepID=A0A0V1MWE9_9BILA|nr:hypothetical protein T10_7703 [Trichinella papuae]
MSFFLEIILVWNFSLIKAKQNTWTAGVSIPVPLACKASALPFELAALLDSASNLLGYKKNKFKSATESRLCVKQANDRIAVARIVFLTSERISVEDLNVRGVIDAEFGGTLNWRKDLPLIVDPCAATTVE